LENIVEPYNVNYNFYPNKLNIKADLIITLSEDFPPFKLELELELKDENIVSIDCIPLQFILGVLLIVQLNNGYDYTLQYYNIMYYTFYIIFWLFCRI